MAACAYIAYALFVTWPLATNPGGQLGNTREDLAGATAQIGAMLKAGLSPFAPGVLHAFNAPHGLAVPWVLNWATAPDVVLNYGLAYAFGPVAAAAVFLWLSYVLSGLSMFLLTRRLFGSQLAAGLAGFAFAFYPFAINKVAGHVEFVQGWVLVLCVWRMLELGRQPSARNGLLAGCAAAFCMWFTFYFILIGGVMYMTLGAVAFWVGVIRGEPWRMTRALLVSAVPVVLLLGGLGYLTLAAGGAASGTLRVQEIGALYAFSAQVPQWLLPDIHNLLFGGLTRPYLVAHLGASNWGESSLYLGLSVVALAIAGLGLTVQRIRRQGLPALSEAGVIAGLAATAISAVAALFSLAPTVAILGHPVTMPSGFVYEITSTWRVPARFVEVIELGLSILLAAAAAWLLVRVRGRTRWLVFAGLAVVLVFDLWARPAVSPVQRVAMPAEYQWLQQHPGGVVADYPLLPAARPVYSPLLYAWLDGHPSFQGYREDSQDETLKLGLADLADRRTAAQLAAQDVRYIVVHPGYPGGGTAALRRQGYVLRASAPNGQVWQVEARPAVQGVEALADFEAPEGTPGSEYRWVTGTGLLRITAQHCAACRAELSFFSFSNTVRRTLTVRQLPSGRMLAKIRVPVSGQVRVDVRGIRLAGGSAKLELTTDIPPLFRNRRAVAEESVTVGPTRLVVRR